MTLFNMIVQHMKDVERAMAELPPNATFAFGLACTERQWPVFERASQGSRWLKQGLSAFRQAIDAAWEHVIHSTPLPPTRSVDHSGEMPLPEDIVDAPSSVAHTIANSIVDLLSAIDEHDPTYPHHLSGRNLGLLEMLDDELSNRSREDSEHADAARQLIDKEMQQQNRDLYTLRKDSSASTIEELRRTAAGKNLFGQLWFP